jgi:type IV pilus assembly protein PilB
MAEQKDPMKAVKDILLMEIPLPFSRKEGSAGAGGDDSETDAPQKKLEEVLKKLEEQGKDVGGLMVERGLLSEDALDRVRREQNTSGLGFPQALVRLKVVPPGNVSDVIEALGRTIMDEVTGQPLVQKLLEEELIEKKGIEQAEELCRTGSLNIEQALLELKLVDLKTLGKVYEEVYDIPSVDLKKVQVDSKIVKMVPDNIMRDKRLVAFRRRAKDLDVAMMDPRDRRTIDRLKIVTGLSIQPYLADLRALGPILRKFVPGMDEAKARIREIATTDIQQAAEEEPTVQLVNKIIEGGVNSRATDIHLDPQEDHLRVRYRIDGMMYDIMSVQGYQMDSVVARVKVLSDMNITEKRRPQDGHISFRNNEVRIDLRVSTLPTHMGEKLVLRLLDDTTVLKGMRQLGLEDKDLENVERLIRSPFGMFLATGPIGAGKTTTLYAALSEVNQANRNIITIEDPIEYQLPGINQVQVDPGVDLNFPKGLRGILRQDADILMVGEIRDAETARTAVRAAMTGHLLFSTLHTNYAVNAITTLRHLEVQPFLIAGSVLCVVAQRLVRKVCENCAESFVPPAPVRLELGLAKNSRKQIKRAVGCTECYHTGYTGRTGIYEVLVISEKIKNLILDGASESEIVKVAKHEGMTTLGENGRNKVLAGQTTFDEFMRVINI